MRNMSKVMKSSVRSAARDGGAAKSRPLASSEVGLVSRICAALDTTPFYLARTLGVEVKDVSDLLNIPASKLVDVDRSIVLTSIAEYTHHRIGVLLAIYDELQAKMNEDIKRRIIQRGRFKR